MANNSNSANLSGWDKVVAWYGRHAYAVQMVYSIGASIVIVGALFKILHWPGASYVLMAGMFTESFLFLIGIFEKPHVTYHWENVYPQLTGSEVVEVKGFNGNVETYPKEEHLATLSDNELKAIKDNMAGLAKVADQLGELTQVTTAGSKLTSELAAAGKAVNEFANSQTSLAGAAQNLNASYQTVNNQMSKVAADTVEYGKNIEGAKAQAAALASGYEQHLKSINAAYELQLKGLQTQAKTYETIVADTEKLQQQVAAGLKAGESYAANAQKLAAQVADLNKVYGNMLNALA